MADRRFIVREVVAETPLIRAIVLSAADGAPLPPVEPGAHIRVRLPDGQGDRPYSLVDLPEHRTGDRYVLGVRLEEPSQGGSRYMHSLKPGDSVLASEPRNNFPLVAADQPALLIAGGIGITPILSMAVHLREAGRPFTLHYTGRSRGQLAFVGALERICGDALHLHYDDDPACAFDIGRVLDTHAPTEHLYVCGPAGMIEAVKTAARQRGWEADHIHFELFTPPAPAGADTAFDVEIRSTGQVFKVPPGRSILDVLVEAGLDPIYDCKRGECGVCQVGVVEGLPDHRDVVLSDSERESNTVIQICVSRARSPKLVLDL